MTPIFKCLICRKDIERSTKTFWSKKGHLLCSTCLDNIDKRKLWIINLEKNLTNSIFANKNGAIKPIIGGLLSPPKNISANFVNHSANWQ